MVVHVLYSVLCLARSEFFWQICARASMDRDEIHHKMSKKARSWFFAECEKMVDSLDPHFRSLSSQR